MIKYKIIATLIILVCLPLSTYSKLNSSNNEQSTLKLKSEISRIKADEINVSKKWHENSAIIWMVQLFIALMSISITLVISRNTQKTSLKIAALHFKSTLNTNNRQEWINDVRYCISEFLTVCRLLNIEFQESDKSKERQLILHERMTFNKNKLSLLLNDKKDDHLKLLKAIKELLQLLDDHLLKSKHNIDDFKNSDFLQKSENVLNVGKQLLYIEWNKLQRISKEQINLEK